MYINASTNFYQNPVIISKIFNINQGPLLCRHVQENSCASHNTACTKFHQNPSICSQDIKWKQNSDINQGP